MSLGTAGVAAADTWGRPGPDLRIHQTTSRASLASNSKTSDTELTDLRASFLLSCHMFILNLCIILKKYFIYLLSHYLIIIFFWQEEGGSN